MVSRRRQVLSLFIVVTGVFVLCKAGYVSALVVESVESHDGQYYKDSFEVNETVYVMIGVRETGSLTVDVYIVGDDLWHDGQPLMEISVAKATLTLESTSPENIELGPFLLWDAPLTPGEYDIVVDENRNGRWDHDEAVDDMDYTSGGIYVIPELSLASLIAALMTLTIAINAIKRCKNFNNPQ